MYQVKSSAKINAVLEVFVLKGTLLSEMMMPSQNWWFKLSL